jgi:predicted transcriptional regulator
MALLNQLNEGMLGPTDLAHSVNVTYSKLGQMLHRLRSLDYCLVQTEKDERSHKRKKNYYITPKGTALLQKYKEIVKELDILVYKEVKILDMRLRY